MNHNAPRRIQTIADVLSILASRKASFIQWLDCVAVSQQHNRWDLVEPCALAALQARGIRSARLFDLKEAAAAVAMAHLHAAARLTDLAPAAQRALEALEAIWVETDPVRRRRQALNHQVSQLRELLLMLATPEASALVKVSSLLRKLDRPDLAIEAATKALRDFPHSGPAFCTRGAAYVDLGELDLAGRDLTQAWRLAPDGHTGAAIGRYFLAVDLTDQALEWAQEAVRLSPGPAAARVLAAAAWRARDEAALEEARALLQDEFADTEITAPSAWLALVAAEHLARAGRLDEAEAIARLHADESEPLSWRAQRLLRLIIRERRRRPRRGGSGELTGM